MLICGNEPTSLFWSDSETRDIFTGVESVPQNSTSKNLSSHGWKHVALQLESGFMVLVMQDKAWILEKIAFPYSANGSIIQFQTFGPGQEPTDILDFIGEHHSLNDWQNKVRLCFSRVSPNGVAFRGLNNTYFNTADGDIASNDSDLEVLFPLVYDQAVYANGKSTGGVRVVSFDRLGDITHSVAIGNPTDYSWEEVHLPVSLSPVSLNPSVFNPLVKSRLNWMTRTLDPYERYIYFDNGFNVYFPWNTGVGYTRLPHGFFNLQTEIIETPLPGPVAEVWLDEPDLAITEVVVVVKRTEGQKLTATLIFTLRRQIMVCEPTIIGEFGPPISVIYNIIDEPNVPLMQEASRRLFNNESFSDMRFPEPGIPKIETNNQLSYERLLAHLYNIPYDDPDTLDGYHRSDVETINQLFQTDQIARFGINITLQPFAGPPGTLNRIITVITLDKRKLFVLGRYDPETKQVLLPV